MSDGQHLGPADNNDPNSPDYVNPHDTFDDWTFEAKWQEEIELLSERLAEICDEMRDEFQQCCDDCDHLDEFSHMYNMTCDAAQSLEDYKPAE